MKRTVWQRACLVVIVLCLLTLPSTIAYADDTSFSKADIYIDDKPMNTPYTLRNEHLMVPFLFLKNTGLKVDWDKRNRAAMFSYGNVLIALPENKPYFEAYDKFTNSWKKHPLAAPAEELDGVTFVPLLEIAQIFGMKFSYDAKQTRTSITTNIKPAAPPILKGNTERKLVALTFDDGPDEQYTPIILDILKEKNVPATFFVLGQQVELLPEMTKRIVKEGHSIANHSWNHAKLPDVTSSELVEEIVSTQKEIQKTTGKLTNLFRPPYGALAKSDALLVQQMGLKNVLWSVDTLDWSGLSAEDILAIVRRDITPGGIILQHNFHSKEQRLDGSVEALPIIIDELQKQGYQFVTIETMLGPEQPAR